MQLHSGAFFNNLKEKISQHIKIEIDYCISMAPETTAIKINTNYQMQQSDNTNKGSTNQKTGINFQNNSNLQCISDLWQVTMVFLAMEGTVDHQGLVYIKIYMCRFDQ